MCEISAELTYGKSRERATEVESETQPSQRVWIAMEFGASQHFVVLTLVGYLVLPWSLMQLWKRWTVPNVYPVTDPTYSGETLWLICEEWGAISKVYLQVFYRFSWGSGRIEDPPASGDRCFISNHGWLVASGTGWSIWTRPGIHAGMMNCFVRWGMVKPSVIFPSKSRWHPMTQIHKLL